MFKENMDVKYKISEDDYVKASALYARHTRKQIISYAIALIVIELISAVAGGVVKWAAIGGLIGVISGPIAARLIMNPLITRHHYRKYKAIQQTFSVAQSDEGITFTSQDGSNIVRWENILKWRQNDDYLLIFPMPRIYYIIPKHIESQGFNVADLTNTLSDTVGHET